MTLPKTSRLKRGSDFKRLFSSVRPLSTEHFSIRAHQGAPSGAYKIAVVIPTKLIARATARNTLRRRVAAIISRILREHSAIVGMHAVISVKSVAHTDAADLPAELLSLMKKSGILKQ